MQLYSHLQPFAKDEKQGCAIALGYFDGIHIGHRSVIETAVNWAKAHGVAPALFTFVLPKDNKLKGNRLFSAEEKHHLIASLGVEYYIEPAFEEIKTQTPEEFVSHLIDELGAKAIVCGENFTFGAKAAGNVALLKTLAEQKGVEVFALPMAMYEGRPVSSTRIREAIAKGQMQEVNAMLGAPYAISFPVQHGQGLGRTLAVPTINQVYPEGFQMPKQGIYITRVKIGGIWYPGATGLGSRPTVNQDVTQVTCETFISKFEGDLYDTAPRVEFYQYLGETQKFNSLEELKACIQNAADAAVTYFA